MTQGAGKYVASAISYEASRILLATFSTKLGIELSGILTSGGYEVTVCNDAFDTLSYARQQCVDTVICDEEFPDYSGLELIQSLRRSSRCQCVPIFLLKNSRLHPTIALPTTPTTFTAMKKPIHPVRLLTCLLALRA